jgi:hypothetical protein
LGLVLLQFGFLNDKPVGRAPYPCFDFPADYIILILIGQYKGGLGYPINSHPNQKSVEFKFIKIDAKVKISNKRR